jgi:hypothetical protein
MEEVIDINNNPNIINDEEDKEIIIDNINNKKVRGRPKMTPEELQLRKDERARKKAEAKKDKFRGRPKIYETRKDYLQNQMKVAREKNKLIKLDKMIDEIDEMLKSVPDNKKDKFIDKINGLIK